MDVPRVERVISFPNYAEHHVNNSIRTSKYTMLTFAPLNLYEQFRKQANFYFLIVIVLMFLGTYTPLFVGTIKAWPTLGMLGMMMTVSAVIAAQDDVNRHTADNEVNGTLTEVRDDKGKYEKRRWDEVQVGDVLRVSRGEEIPADMVNLASSTEDGTCFVSTANLDGETNLKLRVPAIPKEYRSPKLESVCFKVKAEPPQKSIHCFSGCIALNTGPEQPLGPHNLLLRGCRMQNADWCAGVVVYTGSETRVQMNSLPVPLKLSNIEVVINRTMWVAVGFQALLAFITDVSYMSVESYYRSLPYLHEGGAKEALWLRDIVAYLLTFFVLYSNMMPISLYATMEVCNLAYSFFIKMDPCMHAVGEEHASARATNLCHELGQVSYIFSDKTGTITKNVMELRYVFVNGASHPMSASGDSKMQLGRQASSFFECLALAHTVTRDPQSGCYEAESPDELAFVKAAVQHGWVFLERSVDRICLRFGDEIAVREYRLLAVNPFDSVRKRMSVLVQHPTTYRYILLVKGADNAMIEEASHSSKQFLDTLGLQVRDYSRQGLRSMVIGRRDLDRETVEPWLERYRQAQTSIWCRDQELSEAAVDIEQQIDLLGVTAVEDELQDDVGDAIEAFRRAGVKLWVLTGDNLETATAIGFSTCVLTKEMQCLVMHTDMSFARIVEEHSAWATLSNIERVRLELALIVEGGAFERIATEDEMQNFVRIAMDCKVVIACRVSPLQKAEFIRLVRYNVKVSGATSVPVTLAIGDGANDVPMLLEAQVGVGIYGREGRQAAMSSDFAISQFKYLKRLLLVHGRWNYRRASKVVLFTFWRNALQSLLLCYYTIISGYSGTPLFEDVIRISFNYICTLPILALGLFDQDVNESLALARPLLYEVGRQGWDLNSKAMTQNMFYAFVHSVIIFASTLSAMPGLEFNQVGDYWSVCIITFTMLVLGVNCRAAMLMTTWNVPAALLHFAAISKYLFILVVYNEMALIVTPSMYQVPSNVALAPMCWVCFSVALTAEMAFDIFVLSVQKAFFPDPIDTALEEDAIAWGDVAEAEQHDEMLGMSAILSKEAFGAQKLWSRQLSHSSRRGSGFLACAAIFFWMMGSLVSSHTAATASTVAPYGFQVDRQHRWAPPGGWPTQATPCVVGSSCTISLPISANMQPPILLSYVLTPCFQNYNNFLRNPALAAQSELRDKFEVDGESLDESGISWASDSEVLKKQDLDGSDEHLAVWMRPGATPLLMKRYGWLHTVSAKDKVTIRIQVHNSSAGASANRGVMLSTVPRVYGNTLARELSGLTIVLLLAAIVVACGRNLWRPPSLLQVANGTGRPIPNSLLSLVD